MERTDHCPNCGHSCTCHTGPYCHDCGEPLVEGRKRPTMKRTHSRRSDGAQGQGEAAPILMARLTIHERSREPMPAR